ncbi:MAG: hypothetical protein OEL54_06400 [Flavobacteriaceae bacterium]|nr:hypothetical protein [Flavobacteriaceae bacterium]
MKKAALINVLFLGFHLYYQIFGDYNNDYWSAMWFSMLSIVIFVTILDCINNTYSKSIKRILRLINIFWAYFFITEVVLLFNINEYASNVIGVDVETFKEFIKFSNKIFYAAFFLLGIILLIIHISVHNDLKNER